MPMIFARTGLVSLELAVLLLGGAASPDRIEARQASTRSASATFDQLAKMIGDHVDTGGIALTRKTRLDQLKMDSLDLVEFAIAIEKKFGVHIDDDTVCNLT